MTIGPLQLVLVKFQDEKRTQGVTNEIKAARSSGSIRLVDLLYVYKDMNGVLQEKEHSDLAETQKAEYGLVLKGLLGIRAAQKTSGSVDKITEAMSFSSGDFGITSDQVQQIGADLPNGGSAILILFEHIWAIKLKEALLNAGGELIAQGLLSPEVLALGGTTLEEAITAVQKIHADAEQSVAEQVAEADQKLIQAKAEADAKIAEAQRVLDDAEAQAADKMEQAKMVAAAAIAAGVRTAADELQEADALSEQSKLEAEALLEKSKREAMVNVNLGAAIASSEVQRGKQIAQETIEEGVRTDEQIKAAAATEALKILLDAQIIERKYSRQAISVLVSASLIQRGAEEDTYARLILTDPGVGEY